MSKAAAKIGLFFAAFGLIFAGIGGYFFVKDQRLAASGVRASGEVVALHESYDSDGDRTYAPVFVFQDANGTRHEVTSSVKTSPPAFSRGEAIEVIYDPALPGQAVIDSFTQRHLFPLAFGGMGGVFAAIGLGLAYAYHRRRKIIADLKQRGMRINAEFQRCYLDTSVKINGRSPYKVTAQATHPATGKLASFKSDAIWVNLSDELRGRTVPVMVDHAHPKRHWIDLSEWVDESEQA